MSIYVVFYVLIDSQNFKNVINRSPKTTYIYFRGYCVSIPGWKCNCDYPLKFNFVILDLLLKTKNKLGIILLEALHGVKNGSFFFQVSFPVMLSLDSLLRLFTLASCAILRLTPLRPSIYGPKILFSTRRLYCLYNKI